MAKESDFANYPVFNGRRLVEIKMLAAELWCTACDMPLSLRNIKSEQLFGLASIFQIQCKICDKIYFVHTNYHRLTASQLFDVNCKLAIGKNK